MDRGTDGRGALPPVSAASVTVAAAQSLALVRSPFELNLGY